MKRIALLTALILLVAILAGCNTDSLGDFSEGLLNVTAGNKDQETVSDACDKVQTLLSTVESNVEIADSLTVKYKKTVIPFLLSFYTKSEDGKEYDCEATFAEDTSEQAIINGLDSMVKAFLNVKYSVSNDEALRLLLATEYSGKTGSRPYYRDLYEVVTKSETYVKTIVPVIIPLIESDINELKGIKAPFPLQTYDFSLLYPRIKPLIYDHPTYWNLVRSGTEMDTVIENFMDYLMTLTNRIAQVCDGRTTRTVGDKIAITLMMKVMDDMDSLLKVFDEYAQDTTYDLVMQLKPEELDDLLASLEVMAYIYGLEPEFGDILTGSN